MRIRNPPSPQDDVCGDRAALVDWGGMSESVVGSISQANPNADTPITPGTPSSKMAKLVASRVYGQGTQPTHTKASGGSAKDVFESLGDHPALSPGLIHSKSQPAGLPFYRNPAQQVEVATTIAVGRTLDVRG